MIDETVNDQIGKEPERTGYCQDCGKPLTRETVRTVGSGVFCEPCLDVRQASGGVGAAPPPPPYGAVPPTPPFAGGTVYTEPFPPVGGSNPSPGLAGFLGLIPGVGAMYNGQFAKGIAHIVIYAVLQSVANHNGVLNLLVAGWVIYQVFDAYHTAKARRDGTPLPDPFGLNNIGAHVGIHFRGNGAGGPPNPIHSAGHSTYSGSTGFVPPQPVGTPPPDGSVPPAQAWTGVPVPPPVSPYTQSAPPWETPAWTPPPPAASTPGYSPVAPGYPPVSAGYPPPPTLRTSRFPGAAMWLIGFGVLFLLLNVVPDLRFSVHRIFPFLLMALGIGLFFRRMFATGGIGPFDGEGESYASRTICSLRAPVVLITVGVLWSLQDFDVIRFGRTWPVLVIVIGVLMLLERSLGSRIVPVIPLAGVAPPPDASAASGDGKGI